VVVSGGAPPFVRIIFGQMTNAVVDMAGGQSGVSSNQTVNFSPYLNSFTFYVRRVQSGSSTVPLTIVDACQNNPWKTLVGGGQSAF
jgi:hypothetical protein